MFCRSQTVSEYEVRKYDLDIVIILIVEQPFGQLDLLVTYSGYMRCTHPPNFV